MLILSFHSKKRDEADMTQRVTGWLWKSLRTKKNNITRIKVNKRKNSRRSKMTIDISFQLWKIKMDSKVRNQKTVTQARSARAVTYSIILKATSCNFNRKMM